MDIGIDIEDGARRAEAVSELFLVGVWKAGKATFDAFFGCCRHWFPSVDGQVPSDVSRTGQCITRTVLLALSSHDLKKDSHASWLCLSHCLIVSIMIVTLAMFITCVRH